MMRVPHEARTHARAHSRARARLKRRRRCKGEQCGNVNDGISARNGERNEEARDGGGGGEERNKRYGRVAIVMVVAYAHHRFIIYALYNLRRVPRDPPHIFNRVEPRQEIRVCSGEKKKKKKRDREREREKEERNSEE